MASTTVASSEHACNLSILDLLRILNGKPYLECTRLRECHPSSAVPTASLETEASLTISTDRDASSSAKSLYTPQFYVLDLSRNWYTRTLVSALAWTPCWNSWRKMPRLNVQLSQSVTRGLSSSILGVLSPNKEQPPVPIDLFLVRRGPSSVTF